MAEVKRTKREYGGFLPLELNPGVEYFAKYEPYLGRFNSVKAGLDFLIRRMGKKRIYISYYYCPSTVEAIKQTGIEVCFYHINDKLMPENIIDDPDSIFLLVDYFGICSKKVNLLSESLTNTEVIVDRAHGFYEEPLINERIHNVYSAKKFFGIPDGAYIVSKAITPNLQAPIDAYGYAGYLILTYEEGTNAAYARKKEVDKEIEKNYNCMSKLAIGLLKNVNYERVRIQREINYRYLFEEFKDINALTLPEKCAAYQFPLLIKDWGEQIKRKLVEDCIFVPTLWSGKDLAESGNDFEKAMMNDCVFLPIDQRYDKRDMEYIASKVKEILTDLEDERKYLTQRPEMKLRDGF